MPSDPLPMALGAVCVALVAALSFALAKLRALRAEHRGLTHAHGALRRKYQPIADVEEERLRIQRETEAERARAHGEMEADRARLRDEVEARRTEATAALRAEVARLEAAAASLRDELAGERDRATAALRGEIGALRAQAGEMRAAVEAERARTNAAIEAERARLLADVRAARAAADRILADIEAQKQVGLRQADELWTQIGVLRADLDALDERADLQSFGFYRPRYEFTAPGQYQARLEQIRDTQKAMLKHRTAAVCAVEWTVNGSAREGQKQINQTLKLMLRAFNGECDAAISKVRYDNVHVMATRIRKAAEAINGLAQVQQAEIVRRYVELKLEELHLVHEHAEKVQEEKEEQRRIREQMREEEIAQRELEKARVEAEREEARAAEALRKARAEAAGMIDGARHARLLEQIAQLEARLAEAHANRERALARAQMTRSGYVYVVSNVGSFGEHVYKIGMTRRLDPLDRVRELGDASVPFQFDVHALIFSDDAPGLENRLHRAFSARRINRVNEKKEFFHVTIDEIAAEVEAHHGAIHLTRAAEAVEYRKTLALLTELGHTAARHFPAETVLSLSPGSTIALPGTAAASA